MRALAMKKSILVPKTSLPNISTSCINTTITVSAITIITTTKKSIIAVITAWARPTPFITVTIILTILTKEVTLNWKFHLFRKILESWNQNNSNFYLICFSGRCHCLKVQCQSGGRRFVCWLCKGTSTP